MIIGIQQTKRAPKPTYLIISLPDQSKIGKVDSEMDSINSQILNYSILGRQGKMVLGDSIEAGMNVREKLKKALTYVIYDETTRLGRISADIKNIKKFGPFGYGYNYYIIETENELYFAYEYGAGVKKGHYWSLYKQDNLVGMIEKIQETVNTYDQYIIYCEDQSIAFWLIFLALQIDNFKYSNYTNQMGAITTKERYDSRFMPKELKDKYNPDYIDRIRRLEDGRTI